MRIVTSLLAATAFSASAQTCENVIALSKTVTNTVSDKSAFEQHAASFCNEYRKASIGSSSTNAGASWKFIAASYGNSNMSQDEVASKVCAADSSAKSSNDAYKNYVETIAQGAFPAYEQCVKFSQSDVKFDVDLASVLPAEFTIVVGYVNSSSGGPATFEYSAPQGVTCRWSTGTGLLGGGSGSSTTLRSPSSAALKCLRADPAKRSYVRILRTSGVGGTLTLPWIAYSSDGIPVTTLQSLRSSVNAMEAKLATANATINTLTAGKSVPMYQCPNGKTPGANPNGGAWGFYSCMGQITNTATCQVIEYPWIENRACTPVGTVKIY